MSELESLRALDSAIEYLTGEYDEEFPMVAGLISLRASLASITQERQQLEIELSNTREDLIYARRSSEQWDANAAEANVALAALTQERDALQIQIKMARDILLSDLRYTYGEEGVIAAMADRKDRALEVLSDALRESLPLPKAEQDHVECPHGCGAVVKLGTTHTCPRWRDFPDEAPVVTPWRDVPLPRPE